MLTAKQRLQSRTRRAKLLVLTRSNSANFTRKREHQPDASGASAGGSGLALGEGRSVDDYRCMGVGAWFRMPDARRFWALVASGGLFFVGLSGLLTYSTYDLPRTSHATTILGGIAFALFGAIPLAIGVRGIRAGVQISE